MFHAINDIFFSKITLARVYMRPSFLIRSENIL
jgi:hypothetical protein